MARVRIAVEGQDPSFLNVEIAHLRGLDLKALRARWRVSFGRDAPPHIPRHLLFAMIAYRLQAEVMGDLDAETVRTPPEIIDRMNAAMVNAMNEPTVKQGLSEQGVEYQLSSPEAFGHFVENEIRRRAKVVKDNKIMLGE
jgi:DUF2924 family protein